MKKYSAQTLIGFFLLISVPALYFYPFSLPTLALSILLAFALRNILIKKDKNAPILLFVTVLALSFFVSGHKMYLDMAIENVTNSQRGEHPAFQTNVAAKILHNKTTTVIYYLQNLSDRLSISTIFASGTYPNLSKYLPLGFLFPWYLIGFILSVKRKYQEYLNCRFLASLSALLILSSVFAIQSAEIFMFAVIWFICFESIEQIAKLPRKLTYPILFLNLVYLGIFLLSYKVFLNQ